MGKIHPFQDSSIEVLQGKQGLKAGLVFVERNFQWHIENPQ